LRERTHLWKGPKLKNRVPRELEFPKRKEENQRFWKKGFCPTPPPYGGSVNERAFLNKSKGS